jgi:glycosyltransferase involved in cell wall biosynthesis
MITVVIPLYNKAPLIGRTLDSVAAQTYTDYEVVVVDDGSTDDSPEIVAGHKFSTLNSKLKLIRQTNAGVSAARNRGIVEAQGEYIAFLDADDEWKPNYLATQMALVEKYPQCDVFATNYEFRDEKGIVTPTLIRKLPFEGEDGELTNYFEVASCSHPPICSISIMVRKSVIESVGGFPIGIKSGEDLLTWARLAARYRIAYSKEVKAVFYVEGYKMSEKPKRVPAEDDVVGKELETIAQTFHPQHIKHYISHWHKMRSSIYMRLGMRRESLREAVYGLKSHPGNYKLYLYIILNFIPKKLRPF